MGGGTDYHWRANSVISTMKEGFSWIKTDSNGYNNLSVPNQIDVLVLGSSHMEALQVRQNRNTVAFLVRMLPNLSIYNLGISGHTIYRCADNAAFAVNEFQPQKYLVIETNKICLDIDEMKKVVSGEAIRHSASPEIPILVLLQRVPAFKLLYSQINSWKENNSKNNDNSKSVSSIEEYQATLNMFLEIIKEVANENGIRAIIIYDPPQEFDEEGNLDYFHTEEDAALFKEACEMNNIVFVDMTESFKDLYATEHQLAHGFINTGVGTGHLNKYGHRVIAEKLAEVIQGLEAK